MKTYNFMKQFAGAVESGKKTCTIRRAGKRAGPELGETVRLYTGMRSNQCRHLGDFKCVDCRQIIITRNWTFLDGNSDPLSAFLEESLSKRDGHRSVLDFRHFFLSQVGRARSFRGRLFEWGPL